MRMAIASAYVDYRRARVQSGDDVTLQVVRLSAALWQGCAARLRVWHCVLTGGHFSVLYTGDDRLALRCVGCGHQSPGWEIHKKKTIGCAS
jgi:hypothetical protein